MNGINKIKEKYLRKIIQGFSLTAMAFVFQACYGPPQDFRSNKFIEGIVKDEAGNPIQNIKISLDETERYTITDTEGKFYTHVQPASEYKIHIEDTKNNFFSKKDTTISNVEGDIFVEINLAKK